MEHTGRAAFQCVSLFNRDVWVWQLNLKPFQKLNDDGANNSAIFQAHLVVRQRSSLPGQCSPYCRNCRMGNICWGNACTRCAGRNFGRSTRSPPRVALKQEGHVIPRGPAHRSAFLILSSAAAVHTHHISFLSCLDFPRRCFCLSIFSQTPLL